MSGGKETKRNRGSMERSGGINEIVGYLTGL